MEVPRVAWKEDTGIKVLGLPVNLPGSPSFARSMLLNLTEQMKRSCGILVEPGDAQTEQILLRYCLDACRITHFLRGDGLLIIQS